MTDFNNPTTTSAYTVVLSTINDKIASVAKMLFSSDSNIPVGTLQYNRTTRVFEEWNGSGWTAMRVEQAGIIKAFGGSTAPAGHLLCNGAAVSRTTYADLFAAIGTFYGAGDGTTTFNLPNPKGRFLLGKADAGTGSTLGATGGALDHVHSVKAHHHGMGAGADLNITASGSGTTSIENAGHTHSGNTGTESTLHSHTGTTNTDGAHNHSEVRGVTADSGSGNLNNFRITGGSGSTRAVDVKTTDSSHAHNFTTTGQNVLHTHPFQTGFQEQNHTHTTPNHAHAAGNFSGRIGNVTTGVDGNVAQDTLGANPAFLVTNYIITI
jgi:microcystin-dependent protein